MANVEIHFDRLGYPSRAMMVTLMDLEGRDNVEICVCRE